MRHARTPRQQEQNWATFLDNHTQDMWACDFLQVTDLFFRSLFAFFIIDIHTRQVIHVGVTRSPTDAWTAQQVREATPYGQGPKYLIRDRDTKFGLSFTRVAATSGIKILKTPIHAPRANAICFEEMVSSWLGFPPRRNSKAGWSRRNQACSFFQGMTHRASTRGDRPFVTFLTHFPIFFP